MHPRCVDLMKLTSKNVQMHPKCADLVEMTFKNFKILPNCADRVEMTSKKNSFLDFISAAKFLIEKKINEIANVVETVKGVRLLNIDPGKATNRTVITFVGEPENVVEAAFLLIQKAQQLIEKIGNLINNS